MSRARQVANFDPALFAADEVSGDKVSGGTIGAGTYNATIGSSATFPAGHILQVKEIANVASVYFGNGGGNWPTAVGFDSEIQSSSDVLISGTFTTKDANSTNTNYFECYANGGGLGSTTSGKKVLENGMYYNSGNADVHDKFSFLITDLAPGSTTPTYNLYIHCSSGIDLYFKATHLIIMEVAR